MCIYIYIVSNCVRVFVVRVKPKRFPDKCAVCTYKYTLYSRKNGYLVRTGVRGGRGWSGGLKYGRVNARGKFRIPRTASSIKRTRFSSGGGVVSDGEVRGEVQLTRYISAQPDDARLDRIHF